jgi:hypothetical protein
LDWGRATFALRFLRARAGVGRVLTFGAPDITIQR